MSEEQNQVLLLQQKLADLKERQELFHSQILQLHVEIEKLKKVQEITAAKKEEISPEKIYVKPVVNAVRIEDNNLSQQPAETRKTETAPVPKKDVHTVGSKSDMERFIGENLINKIGIAITVIGVAIGAKYAIDHQLISPLTRIISGYLVGFGLLFFALWLKKQYENFSAVLLSGSMAIMYFVTYAAYSFYTLYPQIIALILMVVFTAFTVTAALHYNREIIAIIGLVGACAVPFLLNEGSEKVEVLFSYIAIINAGILVISVKKYWKPLYFSAFLITWLIFLTWFASRYHSETQFATGLIFMSVFFIIFYLTFLSYKLIRREKFDIFDILLLLLNSFFFYGIGYAILKNNQPGENLLGLFTLGNATIHLIVGAVIYRNKLADRNLFYFVSGLALVFLTIAIPVQLDGNWVTLLWICKATVLFYIGRAKAAPVYEYISYPLLLLSFFSLLQDWFKTGLLRSFTTARMEPLRNSYLLEYHPFQNIQFLITLIFITAFAIFLILFYSKKYTSPFSGNNDLRSLFNFALPALFIFVVYQSFNNEISAYCNRLIIASKTNIPGNFRLVPNKDLLNFKDIWTGNYSLFFFAALSFLNTRLIRNRILGSSAFWLSVISIFVFLSQGLYCLSELRDSYLSQYQAEYFQRSSFNLYIRYICFVFAALPLLSASLWIRKEPVDKTYKVIFSLLFHLTIIWVLSSEMLSRMDILKMTHSYKFGLSILWGIYALLLIILGISGKKIYLRIAGMSLFGITLAKLFFYDITRLDTILKTILFLALGILMLIVSFLYNKYKTHLFGETGDR